MLQYCTSLLALCHFNGLEFTEENTRKLPIRLVSFSKGCVVLNQLLLELPLISQNNENTSEETCLQRVQTLTWLDSGLPGNSGAWMANEDSIEIAASIFQQLEIHTTPYQMEDNTRTWVAKEKKRFVQLLRKHKANVLDIYYFNGEARTLEMHFKLIQEFRTKSII